jgi:hypothetical protein
MATVVIGSGHPQSTKSISGTLVQELSLLHGSGNPSKGDARRTAIHPVEWDTLCQTKAFLQRAIRDSRMATVVIGSGQPQSTRKHQWTLVRELSLLQGSGNPMKGDARRTAIHPVESGHFVPRLFCKALYVMHV